MSQSNVELDNRAIDAIIAHNNAPGRLHDDKWSIIINGLKKYFNNQQAIAQNPSTTTPLPHTKSNLESDTSKKHTYKTQEADRIINSTTDPIVIHNNT